MTSNILVPHEFFKKSKKEYNNWIFAFFRELIQNSVDAKADKIDFEVSLTNDLIKFVCIDNGHGMNEDVLTNVLLCLGGSKKSEDAIGGFGYAKTLLFFAHKNYIIETRDNVVTGSGGSYDLTKSLDSSFDGTKITIFMEKQDELFSSIDHYTFEYELCRLLKNSCLPKVNFSWNRSDISFDLPKMNYKFPTTIGKLNFSDSDNTYGSTLWVRVNGLAMFEHTVYNRGQCFEGYLDLDKCPTEVLTSNRDALKGDSRIEFNKIIESLQNERSSLKSESTLDFVFNPISHFLLESQTQQETSKDSSLALVANKSNPELSTQENLPPKAKFSPFAKIQKQNEKSINKIQKLQNSIDSHNLPSNFTIKDSGEIIDYAFIKKTLNQSFPVKMAHNWKKIVYTILNSNEAFYFVNEYGIEEDYYGQEGTFFYHSRPIHTGFCFDDNFGLNIANSNHIRILINIEKIKQMKQEKKLNNNKLFDIAFHEISHIFIEGHGENFSSFEMMNIKWKFYDYYNIKDIKKISSINFF